jgi:PAS domain S-box-containing protein
MIGYLQIHNFSKRSEKLESEYTKDKKTLIKQEVLNVTEYISRVRIKTQEKIKARIKKRTYEAHAIATNIFNKFNKKLPEQKVKKLIIEALRPLKFFNNTGYYFIHSLDGVLQLHAMRPELEGSNRLNLKSSSGQNIVKNLFNIVNKSGEGFLSYKYPASKKNIHKELSKITFAKYFKPYNWSIATGDYLENIEKDLQTEILEHIEHLKFGENGYVFVVDFNGNILMNASQKHLIGTNMSKVVDPNGINVFQEERKAVGNPDGDFINYVWNKPSSSSPSPKITFIKGINDWQWMIGTGLYTDDIYNELQKNRDNLRNKLFQQAFYAVLIIIISSLIIIYISNKFTLRFTSEIGLFLSFFVGVSEKAKKINPKSLRFIEFKNLALSANKMLTKKNKTEKSLRTSEKKLKEAQRITHFGSWEYDIKKDKLQWSDEVYRILGLNPKNTPPSYKTFISIVHPEDKSFVDEAYKDSIKNKTPYSIEHRICLNDGTIKHVRQHAEIYYDDTGKAVSSSGTIQDITELKDKEDQLRRTQKMDALGKLTGGIAHDYNNMMSVIIGYSELLLPQVKGKKKAIEYIQQILTASDRARTLTDKLMSFSRYKFSETEIIDINKQIQAQQQLLEKTLTARIQLTLDLASDIWLTQLDSGDLNDAIINMSINASHAIEGNGTMTITTQNIYLNENKAEALELEAGDYILLSLEDSGSGMDSKTISQIFDPFFSTKGERGTGLGLSQVYGFAKRSGGTIDVQSQLGHGSKFTFYFPRHHAESEKTTTINNISSPSISGGSETILVVDDESALCELSATILKTHGYQVLMANSAKQALELLKTEHINLLFSDIIMPKMNGYELAEIVKKKYPDVIIQFVSGFNDIENLNIDISDLNILQKPFTHNELLILIRKLLDNKKIT